MKRIVLKTLSLINFKGIKNLTVNFGREMTEIRGANATGKSTVADAFNWVLFGKDAAGNSDTKFGIKKNDTDGNPIPKLDHEVTAILDIDGQTVELRRVLSEDWVTPRGKSEPELKGNFTSYFYNGVPMKESEYREKINAIVDETLFRMIANPLYFAGLKWEEQRAILLKIAGDVTIATVAAGRAEFAVLMKQLSGKSLQEYKAEISARKKKLKEALDLIPARIDEVTRATPEAPDYAALEAEISAIEKIIETVEAAMQNAAEFSRQENEAQRKIQDEINVLKTEQQRIVFEAKYQAIEAWNEANAGNRELIRQKESLEKELRTVGKRVEENKASYRQMMLREENMKRAIEEKRRQWYEMNEREYNPSASELCPNCGYDLLSQRNEDARAEFEQLKSGGLDSITEEGKLLTGQLQTLQQTMSEVQAEIDLSAPLMKEMQTSIDNCTRLIKPADEQPKCVEPKGEEIPEYVAAQKQIDALSEQLKNRPSVADNSVLTAKKRELQTQLDGIKKQLSLKEVIEANDRRKDELLREEKSLAQQKADLEGLEYTADMLVKEQMNEVERRVNGRFKTVRFRMFSQQLNGGEKPDCIMYGADGARYQDTNSAGKKGIELDIINTLCNFNGVCAPVFCDNAESVNKYPSMQSQMILMRVTEDKELTVK